MAADKIFYNGQVFTMDPCGQICEASPCQATGCFTPGDCETAMTFKGDSTECIDLKGKTVLPGLGDAHLHASSTCELLFSFDMYNIGLTYDAHPKDAMDIYKNIIAENAAKDGAPRYSEAPAGIPDISCRILRRCRPQQISMRCAATPL